ncbi:meiosis-specific coiled-coil domain-containing protein MEIOC [Astatotilapia calliptera]|uniref:meiosis-specific coiled-coil domain-containing protein MEIOC n=1 Tax=Astatotilapia calliptera TaxID=8154 RepID=UPI000E404954|nr:meiosis-specific coiled-coil domain-containing protein MEIOC [Astatotilapia calliptera]XP_026020182.1 meiosis-specific coiled-coil domain-containing protein MEIOC [Astatotilapia calliptera]XP_026020183.1 meiosis-specific coiled-coil domain-containing protein MEIOC [Astatotilapia calliptera]
MAFDGRQSAFANSLFHSYQRQVGVNAGGGNGSTVAIPFISVPSASQQEQDTASYMPWSYSTQDDPYELIRCAQPSIKSRKPPENADYGGESDLQGLVSNILDDADSQDSFYSEGTLPTCNPIWSPKTLSEELLQYLESEAKLQHNPSFTPNYVSQESFSKAQHRSGDKDVGELMQQSNGLVSNRQWLFNGESYLPHPQKLPPGLPVPNAGSSYTSQMQQNKHVNMPSYNKGVNGQAFNNFPDISDIFRPQSENNTPCFESFYEDNYIQNSIKPNGNGQYVPEHINHLVSSFQSLMTHGNDGVYCGDLGNMHKQIVGMDHEDNVAEQWKITSPTMSRQNSPGNQIPKQLMGELGTVQRERNRVKKQTFKKDGFQDLPNFYPQSTEYVQQPKQFPTLLNPPNQYPKKMVHRENINVTTNQYSKHQLQNKTKSQVQKEKSKMQANGFLREGFARRPQFNTFMREGEAQLLSQNPYFDFQETVQYKRFDGENGMVSAGNVQQFMPLMYPVNDPRRYSGIPVKSNFSSRSTQPYASSVPGMEADDVIPLNESAAFNSYLSDMRTHRRDSTYHGMASAMTTSVLRNHGGPVIQLYFYLDECYEQWRCLEKERKRTEVILTKTFLEKRSPAVTNSNLPKTPPNPTRVDHLIVNQIKEQAKVASLLEKMECLCGVPLPANIHTALKKNHMAICVTQARCKEEAVNMTKHQWQRPNFTKDRDTLLVVVALKDLAATTRKLCTALWCALQITLPKPIIIQDHHIIKEDANKEKCHSSFERYSFRL